MGGGASSPAKSGSGSGSSKAGLPHTSIPGAEAFFDASFAQELIARAGTHRAEFRENLVGLPPVETLALGRPGGIAALALRSFEASAARDVFAVSAPSDALKFVACAEKADFFAIADGHGPDGAACAAFVRDTLEGNLRSAFKKGRERGINNPQAMHNAFLQTNADLLGAKLAAASGASSCAVLLSQSSNDGTRKATLTCGYVGRCRAIVVGWDARKNKLFAKPLDKGAHEPSVPEEKARIVKAGATVATSSGGASANGEPREGLLAILDTACGGDEIGDGTTELVFAPGGDGPGHNFSRCLGDPAARKLGVSGEPSVVDYRVRDHDEFVIIASDGVWDNLDAARIAAICEGEEDAVVVAHKIVAAAYTAQLDATPKRADDATAVVAFLSGVRKGPGAG